MENICIVVQQNLLGRLTESEAGESIMPSVESEVKDFTVALENQRAVQVLIPKSGSCNAREIKDATLQDQRPRSSL